MRIIARSAAWFAVLGMPAVAWALARTAWALWGGSGDAVRVDDLVAMGAAGTGAAVAGYLAMTGWAMLLAALVQGGRAVPRSVAALAPVSWQRVTATALGITMSVGLSAPALALQPSTPHGGWGEPVAAQAASPAHAWAVGSPVGWASPVTIDESPASGGALAVGFAPAPSPPTAASPAPLPPPPPQPVPHQTPQSATPVAAAAGTPETAPADAGTYIVERGDSLWRITASLLGSGASDASINEAWPELYAANAGAVGADPALIHPGLVLVVPSGFPS